MVTIIRIILFSMGAWMSSLQMPHGCIIFQEPGIKIQALQLQMHRFLKTGYSKSYHSLVMGPAVPREYDCVWVNMTRSQSINTRNTAIVRKRNEQNRPGCFVIKKCVLSSYWPIYLLFLPPRCTWCCDAKICIHSCVSASTVSLCYRTSRHISVSAVKRHQTTFRYNELAVSWRIQATCTTGTEVFTLSEARWMSLYHTNFFHPQTSNQTCFPEKSLEILPKCFGNCSTDERLTFSTPKLAAFIVCKVISMRHPRCPSYVTQNEYSSLSKVNSKS